MLCDITLKPHAKLTMANCSICGKPNADRYAELVTGKTRTMNKSGMKNYYHTKNKLVCRSCKTKMSLDNVVFFSMFLTFPILWSKSDLGFWYSLGICVGIYFTARILIRNL